MRLHSFYLVDRLLNSESHQLSKRSSDLLLTQVFSITSLLSLRGRGVAVRPSDSPQGGLFSTHSHRSAPGGGCPLLESIQGDRALKVPLSLLLGDSPRASRGPSEDAF